jgi:hypothetical protein
MTEKKPTVAELEIKLANSKVTKPRIDILATITGGYRQEIYDKYSPLVSEQQKVIREYKVPNQKGDVEKIVAAIKSVAGGKYELVSEVVCKIADGNNLVFTLRPIYDKIPVVATANKKVAMLTDAQKASEKKLADWIRRQLYNIANGRDFEEFKV